MPGTRAHSIPPLITMMNRFRFFALTALAATWSVCACVGYATASDNIQTFVEFNGEIVDQDAYAVSAVLPLEFRIYTSENAKKPIASEKHFVSVVDGKYTVTLGDQTVLKSTEPVLYVAVLLDGKELMRQKVSAARHIVDTPVTPNTARTKEISASDNGDFSLKCPKGYVMTGIEGSRSNGQFENLRIVCSNVF